MKAKGKKEPPPSCMAISHDYAASSSLHGVAYVMDRTLKTWERIVWLMVVLASLILVSIWIGMAYTAWDDDPVITSIKTTGRIFARVFQVILIVILNASRCPSKLCSLPCHHDMPKWLSRLSAGKLSKGSSSQGSEEVEHSRTTHKGTER